MAVATNEEIKVPIQLTRSEKFRNAVRDNLPSFILVVVVWESIAMFVAEPALFPRRLLSVDIFYRPRPDDNSVFSKLLNEINKAIQVRKLLGLQRTLTDQIVPATPKNRR